jgi:hypothetical protein
MFSCSHKTKEQKEWEKYVSETLEKKLGKVFIFPDSVPIVMTDNHIDTLFIRERMTSLSLISYIDITCSACLSDFAFWKNFIEECNARGIDCPLLLYINADERAIGTIRKIGFKYPFLLDKNDSLIELNQLWDKRFQTALIDKDGVIKLLGSPIFNKDFKKLYIEQLEEWNLSSAKY